MTLSKLLLFLVTVSALAQAPLKFEVATIKPAPPNAIGRSVTPTGPRITYRNMSLKTLVYEAFAPGLGTAVSVRGGPEWVDKVRYDIEALAAGTPTTREFKAMLQALLEDRFALKTHREDEAIDALGLLVARSDGKLGPKVEEWNGTCSNGAKPMDQDDTARPSCLSGVLGPRVILDGAPMFAVAEVLSLPQVRNLTGRMIFDHTGLTGRYKMDLEYAFGSPDAPSIFTAIREQWGLKFEPVKGTLQVVMIDSAQPPTEN